MSDLSMKSIENKFKELERTIDSLKDIIQKQEYENVGLWHENRALKKKLEIYEGGTKDGSQV